jgi:hypothetical protein
VKHSQFVCIWVEADAVSAELSGAHRFIARLAPTSTVNGLCRCWFRELAQIVAACRISREAS